jgi:hypothetical protein
MRPLGRGPRSHQGAEGRFTVVAKALEKAAFPVFLMVALGIGQRDRQRGGDTEACGSCQRRELVRIAFALWVSSFGVVYYATSPLCAPKDGPSQLPPT